uniref:separin-like n=1 Tax=Pristiophorus japonicus TaxID=55135 RepID=UPI00398F7080
MLRVGGVAEIGRRTDNRPHTESLRAELQESLRDVLDEPSESTEHRVTCDRVIRACIQRLGAEQGLSAGHLDSLAGLAELACRGYRASAPPPQGQLYLECLLFHLLRSLALRGVPDHCLALAQHLYQSLERYGPPALGAQGSLRKDYEVVAKNGFSVLWKAGEKAEGEEGEEGRRWALSLRLGALALLALAEGLSARVTPSNVCKKFALACALYQKGRASLSGEQADHLGREFERLLLPAVSGRKDRSPCSLSVCELARQCSVSLCRSGQPDRALQTLTRAQDLLRKGPGPAPPHFVCALHLCRLACLLGTAKGRCLSGPKGDGGRAPLLARAVQLLRASPLAGCAPESKAVSDGCQYLLSTLESLKDQGITLGLEELLQLSVFLDVCRPEPGGQGEEEVSGILKQRFQNLELFTSRAYDFLLETQGKDCNGGEQLLAPCKSIVERMVAVEEALIGQGLTEYTGAT